MKSHGLVPELVVHIDDDVVSNVADDRWSGPFTIDSDDRSGFMSTSELPQSGRTART